MSSYAGRHSCSSTKHLNLLLVFVFRAVTFTYLNTNYVNFGDVDILSCMFNFSVYLNPFLT